MDAKYLESRLTEKVNELGAHRISIRSRQVFCQKKCVTCESGTGHGPYYWAQWRESKDKWASLYLGKSVPPAYRKLLHKKELRKK